jgi:P-type Cu+ transporter
MRSVFSIGGMTCSACSQGLERALNATKGVESATVNLTSGTAAVVFDETVISERDIAKAVKKAGFKVLDGPAADAPEAVGRDLMVAVVLSIVLFYVAMGPMLGLPIGNLADDFALYALLQTALCIPVLIAGRRFYIRGYPALFRGAPNMDTLVAIGTTAAVAYSIWVTVSALYGGGRMDIYYDSAAMIIALVMVGKYLEARSRRKTGDAIRNLADLAPTEATVIRDGAEVRIPVSELAVGDIAAVRPGERIPADGTVVSGSAGMDESMVTGESIPADRGPGDAVIGSTLNTDGDLRIRVDRIGEDSTLSRIITMVREAQGTKAPIARTADRAAGVFVPAVMTVAALSCIIWLMAGRSMEFSLTVFISVLVISCPCALGLATPLAIVVGTGKGAEHGILYKDAASLEASGRAEIAILDKTGTVTTGELRVSDVLAFGVSEETLVRLAGSAEKGSSHPVGKAIADMCSDPAPAADFISHTGGGVSCTVDGKKVVVGNAGLMRSNDIRTTGSEDAYERLTGQGKTAVFISADGELVGMIAVEDTVKPDAAAAVGSLRTMGIRTMMVTGDNPRTAGAVAAAVGIDEVRSEVMPEGKADIVDGVRAEGMTVMVGDGINDSVALARADVGIAIGSGTDIAVESADVVLMNDGLSNVPAALEIGRATMRTVKQNLFLAFCYNAVCIPIAAGLPYALGVPMIHGMPMLAAAAMSLSSVSVVLNALRLRRFKPDSLAVPEDGPGDL